MRLFKEPFIQFLFAGALIFTLFEWVRPAPSVVDDRQITVDQPVQTWLYDNFNKQFGRPPTQEEMDGLVRGYIEHEVKYRESLAMGLDERDSIVRRRMMQKFDFLYGNAAADVTPEPADLRAWHGEHIERYTAPPRLSFEHRWFSPDTRGTNAWADAENALPKIRSGEAVAGDRFPLDDHFEAATPSQVRASFGEEFTASAFDAPVGEWTGPLVSGLGVHLIRVSENQPPTPLPFDEIREAVLADWREMESGRLLEELVARLKSEYDVYIDSDVLGQHVYSGDVR